MTNSNKRKAEKHPNYHYLAQCFYQLPEAGMGQDAIGMKVLGTVYSVYTTV